MTDRLCLAEDCDKPSPSAYLCTKHVRHLERVLQDIGDLWPELHVTLTRQSVPTRPTERAGKSSTRGLPFDVGASETSDVVRSTVVSWLRDAAGDRIPEEVRTIPQACRWMGTYVTALALLPQVGEMLDELASCRALVMRVVGNPVAPVYLGRHSCGEDVWAKAHRDWQTCGCGEVLDVALMREEAADAARSRWATARTITEASAMYQVKITKQQISAWYKAGHLQMRWTDDGGTMTFNVGAVVDLALAAARRAEIEHEARRTA